MTLGQMIQHLRRERGMLQDELAETLGVSRQSVSKWETDAAVPELDRLLQLSDLFGVSLDELVRGEKREDAPAAPPPPTLEPTPAQATAFPPRKIAGTILLCFGGLVWLLILLVFGDFLGGLIFASPFLACGAICFIFRRRVGLWCAWAVYALIDAYICFGVGVMPRPAIFNPHWYTAKGNVLTLIIIWADVLVMIGLIAATLYSYRNLTLTRRRNAVSWMILCPLLFVIRIAYKKIFPHFQFPLFFSGFLFYMINVFLEWLTVAALVTLLVHLTALLRTRRK